MSNFEDLILGEKIGKFDSSKILVNIILFISGSRRFIKILQ